MKSFFHKIVSIGLTFAVLFATSSFSADMHFCCNKLVDIAVFGKAKLCGERVQKTEGPSKECTVEFKDCCSNVTYTKAGEENLKKVSTEFSIENYIFLHSFFYTYTYRFEGLDKNFVKGKPMVHIGADIDKKIANILHANGFEIAKSEEEMVAERIKIIIEKRMMYFRLP